MSAFDALREFATAPHIRDSEACGVIARDLRAAVAEHDALRDAVRGYLATVPEDECDPLCSTPGCSADAASVDRWGRYVCTAHSAVRAPVAPMPPRVVALRALAALVRS